MKWNKSIITVWIIQIIRGENLKKWKTFSFEWWKLSSGWSVLSRPPIQFLFFFPFQLFLMSWMKKKRELTGSGRPREWMSNKKIKFILFDWRGFTSRGEKTAAKRNGSELPANWIDEVGGLWAAAPLPRANAAPAILELLLLCAPCLLLLN